MMPRQQALSILGTMSDDNLMQALSAVGIDCYSGGGREGYRQGFDGSDSEDQELVSWNNTDVKVPPSNRPQFYDKNQTIDVPKAQPAYLRPDEGMEDEISPYAAAMG